jgi:hypothetical protein
MFWRGLSIAGVVLAGLGAAGCLNSEADFQALQEENNTLGAELAEARKENEILTRALEDIKLEQEVLQLLFNAGKSNLNAGRASLPPTALAAGGGEEPAPASGGEQWEDEWQTPQPEDDPEPADQAQSSVSATPPAPARASTAPPPAVPAPAGAPARASVSAAPAPESAPDPAGGGRYYVTKSGDVLSNIARANRTSVAKLLELNPNLRNRRDYVIYANERLRLP